MIILVRSHPPHRRNFCRYSECRNSTGSEPYQLAPDLLIIPVPGHTKVTQFCSTKISFCSRAIISAGLIGLTSWWVSGCLLVFAPLIESTRQLANYSFEWVLPGHRRYHADPETMHQQLLQGCLDGRLILDVRKAEG